MDLAADAVSVDAVRIAEEDGAVDEECVLERVKVAAEAVAGMPYLGAVGSYNRRWYVDAVSLPHDATRRLLAQLFTATSALHTMALDATARDVSLYAMLVAQCARFFEAILACEEAALYAEAEQSLLRRVALGGAALAPQARAASRTRLRALVDSVALVAREAPKTPTICLATKARFALFDLAAAAQTYFRAKEKVLPRLLSKSFRSQRIRTRIEARVLEALSREDGGLKFAALLLCSLSSVEVVREFAGRHFAHDEAGRKAFLCARESLHAQGGLLSIAVTFEEAAKKYATRFSVKRFLDDYSHKLTEEQVLALAS